MKRRVKKSSGNVFVGLGFPPEEAAVLAMRAELMAKLRALVAEGALAAEKEVEHTGTAYPADRVHRYLRARVAGRKTTRPKPTPW